MPVDAFEIALTELKRLRSYLVTKHDKIINRFSVEFNLVLQNAYQVSFDHTMWTGQS